jgi:hypothetical protein
VTAVPARAAVILRAVVCAGLLLCLPVLDFEMARHSVHHLGSANHGCLLASVASMVSAVSPDRSLVWRATPGPGESTPSVDLPRLPTRPTRQHLGRAPPPPAAT